MVLQRVWIGGEPTVPTERSALSDIIPDAPDTLLSALYKTGTNAFMLADASLRAEIAAAVLGTVAAGLAMALFAGSPVGLMVLIGLGASILVGAGISWLVDVTGLRNSIKEAVRSADVPAQAGAAQVPVGP
ncbi:MAG: hypothetical protein DI498_06860 [Paracoccus denitrificans]|nr:MAG: hypothetical protein DI498_06860 [Paracoccus denitrificans]PZO84798.1 MAG: hypothetical protein DI633_06860 [Paracoccus denitrificans]